MNENMSGAYHHNDLNEKEILDTGEDYVSLLSVILPSFCPTSLTSFCAPSCLLSISLSLSLFPTPFLSSSH